MHYHLVNSYQIIKSVDERIRTKRPIAITITLDDKIKFSCHEYLQSALRCISTSGSSWVSGAGPCTVLLKRSPLFRFRKAKKLRKEKCINSPLCTQPVSATKMDEKTKAKLQSRSSYEKHNLWSFPHLRKISSTGKIFYTFLCCL